MEEIAKLDALIGAWRGRETLPDGQVADTLATANRNLETFVVADHVQRRPDGSVFRNHLVYGWDGVRRQFSLYQFDSSGRAPQVDPAFGDWVSDHELVFERETERGSLRITYAFDGANAYALTVDHGAVRLVEGRFSRASEEVG